MSGFRTVTEQDRLCAFKEWTKGMAPIYVLFWFNVEDYVSPEADDALKRLIETFDAQGVRATWKLVGEKLRCSNGGVGGTSSSC